jgi:hypothetical protein
MVRAGSQVCIARNHERLTYPRTGKTTSATAFSPRLSLLTAQPTQRCGIQYLPAQSPADEYLHPTIIGIALGGWVCSGNVFGLLIAVITVQSTMYLADDSMRPNGR